MIGTVKMVSLLMKMMVVGLFRKQNLLELLEAYRNFKGKLMSGRQKMRIICAKVCALKKCTSTVSDNSYSSIPYL